MNSKNILRNSESELGAHDFAEVWSRVVVHVVSGNWSVEHIVRHVEQLEVLVNVLGEALDGVVLGGDKVSGSILTNSFVDEVEAELALDSIHCVDAEDSLHSVPVGFVLNFFEEGNGRFHGGSLSVSHGQVLDGIRDFAHEDLILGLTLSSQSLHSGHKFLEKSHLTEAEQVEQGI